MLALLMFPNKVSLQPHMFLGLNIGGSFTDSLCIKAFMSMFKSFSTYDIRLRGSVQEVVHGVCTEG